MIMPKPSRGGRRSAVTAGLGGGFGTGGTAYNPNPATQQTDDEQTVDDNGVDNSTSGQTNTGLADFRNMTDAQQAAFLKNALSEAPPSFLPDNDLQRVVWALGGDDHPTVVSDAQMDALGGKDIYRQVAGVYDSKFGTNISSAQIANQLITGDFTVYSGDYASAYGRAIYFGKDYNEIRRWYGTSNTNKTRTGGNDSTLIRSKIKAGAKGMTYSSFQSALNREMTSGSQLGRILRNTRNSIDRDGIFALAKGIDYTHENGDYHMVYNRGCLVVSQRTKHNAQDNSW